MLAFLLLVSQVPVAPVVRDQPDRCAASWRAVDLALIGDSIRRATDLVAEDECGVVVRAVVASLAVSEGRGAWSDRVAAERALDEAFRSMPNEPRVFLALAWLRYAQGSRTDALRLLERAKQRGLSGSEPVAFAEFLRGRIHQDWWRDWRSHGHLAQVTEGQFNCEPKDRRPPETLVEFNIACPAIFESIMDRYFISDATLRSESRTTLEAAFRGALREEPGFRAAREALASELVYEGNWSELLALIDSAPEPEDHRLLMLRGLALHELGRESEADSVFDAGLGQMPPTLRSIYEDVSLVLDHREQQRYRAATPADQAEARLAFWRSRDALYLTPVNERLLEHYGRLTASRYLFREPETGREGWATDAGDIWVRFGRPKRIRELVIENGRASFWSYGPDPDFVFARLLTYSPYQSHGEAVPWFGEIIQQFPSRYQLGTLDTVVELARTITRFRTEQEGGWDILVTGRDPEPPGERLLGVTLLDGEFRRVGFWTDSVTESTFATWLRASRPGSYGVATEVLIGDRLIRGRDTVSLSIEPAGMSLSDLLIVSRVRAPRDPLSRSQLSFEFLYDGRQQPGRSVGLFWEIYDPPVDDRGRADVTIDIEVRDARRRPLLARVLTDIARGFRGGQPLSSISYRRQASPVDGKIMEWISLEGDWVPGLVEIVVHVRPTAGGTPRTIRRAVEFR